jgi:hypothetical protein
VHQKAKPQASSSYRRPPITASLDRRGRTSAHGTGRPIFIGPWPIGPAPGASGERHDAAYRARRADERISYSRHGARPYQQRCNREAPDLGWVVLFHGGHILLRVVVYH